jgi:hypothetical protein
MEILVKTEIITESKERKTFKLQCDCCKKEFEGDHSTYQGEVEWPVNGRRSYHHTETHVCIQNTDSYSDDYPWESESYHICPECMRTVVFPLLQEKCGIPPHKNNDWDND